jgi:hypothetical protein
VSALFQADLEYLAFASAWRRWRRRVPLDAALRAPPPVVFFKVVEGVRVDALFAVICARFITTNVYP